MNDSSRGTQADGHEPDLEEHLCAELERADGDWTAAERTLCRKRPESAGTIRTWMAALRERGFLDERGAQPEGKAFPERLGEFRLVERLGSGGMAVVYRAVQEPTGREVALKLIRPEHLYFDGSRERFRREVEAVSRLQHAGIVPVLTVGEQGDIPFIAMERVQGCTFADVLEEVKGEPVSRLTGGSMVDAVRRRTSESRDMEAPYAGESWVDACLQVTTQVARALEHAHRRGILHRDVKPSNIMLTPEGRAMLVDFGLALVQGGDRMTKTGSTVGSVPYLAPELLVAAGASPDERVDVYALGVTLYEMLALVPPYWADDSETTRQLILRGQPVPPRRLNPAVPWDVETVCLKAMDRDAARRYASAGELACDLENALSRRPIQARRPGPVLRARRWVRRHPVLGTALGAAIATVLIGVPVLRAHRAELEYGHLCARAEAAMTGFLARPAPEVGDDSFGRALIRRELQPVEDVGESPSDLYARAIATLPDRPEAWFGRALCPGRQLDERLVDLDMAFERGLAARTFHLARAYLLRAAEEPASERETGLAEQQDTGSPADAYFAGILQTVAGQREAALELFGQAIEGLPRESAIRYRALRARASLRELEGDFEDALADLHVLRDLGDDSAPVTVGIAWAWKQIGSDDAEGRFEEALLRAGEKDTPAAWAELCVETAVRRSPWFARASEAALAANPEAPRFLRLRASSLNRQGRHEEALELCRRALDREPNNSAVHVTRGNTLRELDRRDEALDALDRALVLDRRSVAAHRTRGNVLAELDRLDDALAAFHEAELLAPHDPFTFVARGALLANELERCDDALAQFDRAIDLRPLLPEPHLNRAIVLERLNRYEEALKATDRFLELRPGDLDGLRSRGNLLLHLRRPAEALPVFDELIAREPGRLAHRANRVIALCGLGRRQEALEEIARALALEPDNLFLLRRRIAILTNLGRWEDALAACTDLERIDSARAEAHAQRGILLHNHMNRSAEALDAFEQSLALDPQNAVTWHNKAIVLEALGHFAEACEAATESLKRSEHPQVLLWRGTLLHNRLGRPSDAATDFRRAAELQPENFEALRNLGHALQSLGEFESAADAFGRALDLRPDEPGLLIRRAFALQQIGRDEEALQASERALRLEPRDPAVLNVRAVVLLEAGHAAEAREVVDEVLALAPDWPVAHCNKGRVLHDLRRGEEALSAYDEALRRDPNYDFCRRWRAVLLIELQRFEDALADTDRLLDRGFDRAMVLGDRAWALACLGRFDEIEDPGENGEPSWAWALALKGRFQEALDHAVKLEDPHARVYCLRALGRVDEARELARSAMAGGQGKLVPPRFAYLCAAADEREAALAALASHDGRWLPVDLRDLARIHCLLGDREAALDAMARAVDAGLRLPRAMAPDPDLAPIAEEPEFQALMRRMHDREQR